MAERCAFTCDLSGERSERTANDLFADVPTDERGVWRCPRRPAGSSSRCRLHSPTATDDEKAAEIVRSLDGDVEPDRFVFEDSRRISRATTRFIGVEAERLDLSDRRFEPSGTRPVDFRCAEIETVDLTDAQFELGCRFDGATLGSIAAAGATFDGEFSCRAAEVDGPVDMGAVSCDGAVAFRFSEIGGDVTLDRASAGGRFDFGFTDVAGTLAAEKGSCRGRLTLKEATVERVVAADVAVSGKDPDSSIPGLQFRGLSVAGDLDVENCDSTGTLIGHDLTVEGDVAAAGATIECDVILGTEGSSTDLPNPSLGGTADFSDAAVGREFRLAGRSSDEADPSVGGKLDLSGASIGTAKIAPAFANDLVNVVDLRRAVVDDGFFGQPEASVATYYDLQRATIGSVTLERGDRPTAEYFRFDRTDFDGFRFDESRRDFARKNWRIHDVPESVHANIAVGQRYSEARALARDARTVVSEFPVVRQWLLGQSPPYDPLACAEACFESLSDAETRRIATNGPESERVLGRAVFERERYRVGLVTQLAREHVGRETEVDALFGGAGEQLARLADAVERLRAAERDGGHCTEGPSGESGDPVGDATESLTVALARTLADRESIELSAERAQTTYIKARKGADEVGDSVAAGHFFVKEFRFRRAEHRQLALGEGRPRRRFQAATDYVWNLSFDLLAGYGERPRRVIAASVWIIGLFAFAFYLLGRALEGFDSAVYGGVSGALLLSLESFTSLVLGGTTVQPRLMRFVANVQGFVGAFFIALLVFTLTRSLHR